MYKIDFKALSLQLLPSFLRKPKRLAFLDAMLAPVEDLYQRFLAYCSQARIELSYNGQTIMLEKALNDRFDPQLRRIRIDASTIEQIPFYINWKAEQQPDKYTHNAAEGAPPRYLRSSATYGNPVAFTVLCPATMLPADAAAAANLKAKVELFIKRLKVVGTVHRTIYR